jgi:hypothetical protein
MSTIELRYIFTTGLCLHWSLTTDVHRFTALLATLTPAPSRRAALRLLSGLGLAGLVGPTAAKNKHKRKKKKCAKAGQPTSKKRKKCCKGLVKDATGRCAPPCTPATCAPNACGSVPDGCGGTLSCTCPANQICMTDGTCQPCTVICPGSFSPDQCGSTLQTAMSNGGTVLVCPGTYRGGFTLTAAVTVIGAGDGTGGANNTILEGTGVSRLLTIDPGTGVVTLERLRLTGRNLSGSTGIVHGGTTLRMTECTVSDNTSVDAEGGGIFVGLSSTLELTRCTVSDNRATGAGDGGGIFTAGTTTLTDCVVEANRTDNDGGGIILVAGMTTLAGSTQVRGNVATEGGGIAVNTGTLVIAETCRVTKNTAAAPGQGGGIFNAIGMVTLQGSDDASPIVVNNCHENCAGAPVATCAATPVSCPP